MIQEGGSIRTEANGRMGLDTADNTHDLRRNEVGAVRCGDDREEDEDLVRREHHPERLRPAEARLERGGDGGVQRGARRVVRDTRAHEGGGVEDAADAEEGGILEQVEGGQQAQREGA